VTDAIVNAGGIILIVAIIWWFWLSSVKASQISASQLSGNQPIEIIVEDGVYSPARIEVPSNQELTLRFIRKDASPCAEKVIFTQLDKSLELALNKPTDIKLMIKEAGEYDFSCEMQMYRGRLLVS